MEWLIVLLAAAIAWFFLASMTREENEREAQNHYNRAEKDRETKRFQPVRAHTGTEASHNDFSMTYHDDLSMQTNDESNTVDLPLTDVHDESDSDWQAYAEEQNPMQVQHHDDNDNEQVMNQIGPAPQSIDSRWDEYPRNEQQSRYRIDRQSDDSIHFHRPEEINPIPESLQDVPFGMEISSYQYGQAGQAMNPTAYSTFDNQALGGGVPTFSSFYQIDALAMTPVNNEDIPYLNKPFNYADDFDARSGGPTPYHEAVENAREDDDDDPPPIWSPS